MSRHVDTLGWMLVGECLRGWLAVAKDTMKQKERARLYELENVILTQAKQMEEVRRAETARAERLIASVMKLRSAVTQGEVRNLSPNPNQHVRGRASRPCGGYQRCSAWAHKDWSCGAHHLPRGRKAWSRHSAARRERSKPNPNPDPDPNPNPAEGEVEPGRGLPPNPNQTLTQVYDTFAKTFDAWRRSSRRPYGRTASHAVGGFRKTTAARAWRSATDTNLREALRRARLTAPSLSDDQRRRRPPPPPPQQQQPMGGLDAIVGVLRAGNTPLIYALHALRPVILTACSQSSAHPEGGLGPAE